MPASLVRSRSTRRTATVTISAPEASMARTMVSLSRYFPVPTIRRDWNVRPPILKGVSRSVSTAVVIASTPSDEVHQLDRIPFGDGHAGETGASHDGAVVLHHHDPRIELERREQLEEGDPGGHRPSLAVDHDINGIAHSSNSCSIRLTALAGSAASHSARIAATPYAPASFRARIRSAVTPPMAIVGIPSRAISLSRAGPSGSRPGGVGVRNTGPTPRESAPAARAASASAKSCTDLPIHHSPWPRRASATSRLACPRCTPAAPTASATSRRSLTNRRLGG